MIFATVGTQIPFDRLIRILDRIAAETDEEIVAQTSREAQFVPEHLDTVAFLTPSEFDAMFRRARLVVAHAGMGTIISAMEQGKPLIVFPRKASLGEHRNDHQQATAAQMKASGTVAVAFDEDELRRLIFSDRDLTPQPMPPMPSLSLCQAIKDYIG